MTNEVDIKENDILKIDYKLLDLLLIDHTTGHHIFWATDNYTPFGEGFQINDEITINRVTGENGNVIKPRIKKTKAEQNSRIKDKAEVFTPSWICNKQNNLIDQAWFGKKQVFNKERCYGWDTIYKTIEFSVIGGKSWTDYINDTRLEVSCGEAPYLISRYDTITGSIIPIMRRIGLLDRKLRVVGENTTKVEDWHKAAMAAYKSVYAYEWQGDNLLIARENMLYTFIDYYSEKFKATPTKEMLFEIAEIISWNLWQMDGLKLVVPNSCHSMKIEETSLFGEIEKHIVPCEGCNKNDINKHNGKYCKIMDWETNKPITFVSLLKEGKAK
jgi:hypothetical protein